MTPTALAAPWRSTALRTGPRVPVWAPWAGRMTLHLPATGELMDMESREGGWWISPRDLPDGTDYAYRIDGSDQDTPDPRSAWQPRGVHGPSRTVDTARWDTDLWTDGQWPGRDLKGAVVYELHVGTFTPEGTLDAAASRLEHLAALGVEMIELMPLAAFPGRAGWGYDGVSLWAVHEAYGGPRALARFINAAHGQGIGVCLDVVYNHLGPSGNYLPDFGPYLTSAHTTPWGEAVNYCQDGSEQVRAFAIDAALRWLRDFHVDALRLDAIHQIVDSSPRHVLAELSDAVAALSLEVGRPLSLVAESDLNDVGVITATGQEAPAACPSLGMTAQWADDVHHALHARLTGESHGYYADFAQPGAWAATMERVFLHDGGWSTFRDRPWGAPVPRGTDPRRFIVFGSNHDQVGNRARGDRPAASLEDSVVAAGAALVVLSPYTPMLFMGEEWGTRRPFQYFTDHEDPELADRVRHGRRAEFAAFGWEAHEVPDPQHPATVGDSVLNWAELDDPAHARMLSWYRGIIALRRELALGQLAHGRPQARDLGEVLVVELDLDPAGACGQGTAGTCGELVVAVNLGAADLPLASVVPGAAGLTAALSWQDQSGSAPGALAGHNTLVLVRTP